MAFSDDSSYYLLCSLEILNEQNELDRKADIFTKRTIRRQHTVEHVDTAAEALAVSISEKASVDLPYMAQLTGKEETLQAEDKKDNVVTFEQLGVDRLYVDEAHGFKNLFLYTKMRNVAGLSTSEAQKSSDMFLKCRYMDELTAGSSGGSGRGIVFATGTPVSNSSPISYD